MIRKYLNGFRPDFSVIKNFQKVNGKFDYEKFKNFLNKSGLNEEHYVNEIANEITTTMTPGFHHTPLGVINKPTNTNAQPR